MDMNEEMDKLLKKIRQWASNVCVIALCLNFPLFLLLYIFLKNTMIYFII